MDIYICRLWLLYFFTSSRKTSAFQNFDFFTSPCSLYSIWFVDDIRSNVTSQRLMCVCVCMCERERDKERNREREWACIDFLGYILYRLITVWTLYTQIRTLWQLLNVTRSGRGRGIGKYIYISRLRRKRKDVVERRRIKSVGRVIRLGGNGTSRRTSSPIELYRR